MSDLLKNSLLQQNQHLNKRVHAAVIKVAGQQYQTSGPVGDFARIIYENLARQWDDFLLYVAADPHVQEAAVVNEDATAVVTTNITDHQILNSVGYMWETVARKYASQPAEGEEQ